MKTSIATGLVLAGIISGIYFLYTSDMVSSYLKKSTEEIAGTMPAPGVAGQAKEFGEFTEFFQADLSDIEKTELKKVLENRDSELEKANKILTKEFNAEEGEMEKAFKKVEKIREEIKVTFIPFLNKLKRAEFEEKYRQMGRDLEAEYITK